MSSSAHPARYVPPHRNGTIPDTRYTREQLLDLYKETQSLAADDTLLPGLLMGGWQPDVANGNSAGWGRNDHARDQQQDPNVCWDREGDIDPLGLHDMGEEEREVSDLTSISWGMMR